MRADHVVKYLVSCVDENGDIDYEKFYRAYPKSLSLTRVFNELQEKGFVTFEVDNDGVLNDFDITGHFLSECVRNRV